jgi:L-threonylcarbamoyladenylate synthase
MINKIDHAVRVLKSGGLVAFPTETVYGLGARLSDKKAIRKIFEIKGRPSDNPLIVHIHDKKQLKLLAQEIPDLAKKLMEQFWPGPLTFVLKKTTAVPSCATAGLKTVAIRMPSHPIAYRLLKELNEPIAAPSANRSGRPSTTRYKDVCKELGDRVESILDGGKTKFGLESTVLDVTVHPFRILRPGSVTAEELNKVVPNISAFSTRKMPKIAHSPGMKHRHYVPHCKVVVVQPERWKETIEKWKNKKIRIGILSLTQESPHQKNIIFKKMLNRNTFKYAKNLYATFFEAERAKVQILFVESMDRKGLGFAIMDRLMRASA